MEPGLLGCSVNGKVLKCGDCDGGKKKEKEKAGNERKTSRRGFYSRVLDKLSSLTLNCAVVEA
jgi:hypothetical protein